MNRHLELAGHDIRVDHRSFKAQGIDRQPTIHEGVFAIRMERKGRKSDRREINLTIFKDNSALAYWTEAVINLTKSAILLIPVIANILETIRTELMVLIYDWKYNRRKMSEKRNEIEMMKRAVPQIRAANTALEQKAQEKTDIQNELQRTPKIFKKKRKEIETKLYGLNEEISELETEKNRLSHIAGSTVEGAESRIKTAEEWLDKLEKWDEHLDDAIEEAVANYKEKKADATNCDQDKLRAERMKIRPQKYAEAYDTIAKQYWICDTGLLLSSQKNAADLIGEEADEKLLFPKPEPKQTTKTKSRNDVER